MVHIGQCRLWPGTAKWREQDRGHNIIGLIIVLASVAGESVEHETLMLVLMEDVGERYKVTLIHGLTSTDITSHFKRLIAWSSRIDSTDMWIVG